jgi:hypothetical protein
VAERKEFLPHGGTHFDDMKVADLEAQRRARRKARLPQEVDEDMLPFFKNLKERPHAKVYVQSPKVAAGINRLLTQWYDDGFLKFKPSVSLDPKLRLTQISVEG